MVRRLKTNGFLADNKPVAETACLGRSAHKEGARASKDLRRLEEASAEIETMFDRLSLLWRAARKRGGVYTASEREEVKSIAQTITADGFMEILFLQGLYQQQRDEREALKVATESARLRHQHMMRRLQRSKLIN